jgi:hypothetical protein
VFVHQSLAETVVPAGLWDHIKSTVIELNAEANMSQVANLVENLGLLLFSLPRCRSNSEIAVQLGLGFKTMYHSSVAEAIIDHAPTMEHIKKLFGYNIFHPQAKDVEDQGWLSYLPNLRDNWDTVRSAPIFEKISNLISVAASIGLCSVTNLSWNVKGIEMFRLGSIKKHANAIDLFGAVLDTFITFIEGGFECFRQRSFRPLLFTNDASSRYDDLYFAIIEAQQHAMIFNLAANPIRYEGKMQVLTDLDYCAMLEEGVELAESAFKSAKGTWQASVFEKRLVTLRTLRADYNARRLDGALRYAPFALYIYGPSGVGKSTLAGLAMSDCLKASGANPDPKFTAVLKESDKFDSALKSDTQGIFLDDMGNTRLEFVERSPCDRLIDICNNVVTYANKADLHEKGKIEIRPHVLVITSNAPLADHARKCSIDPFSIVRRGDIHVKVNVKPEFALPDGRLDTKKVNKVFPGDDLDADIWDLVVSVPNGKNSKLLLGPIDGSINETHMNVHEFLEYATDSCEAHFDNQRTVVRKAQNMVKARSYCDVCRRTPRLCRCATPQAELAPTTSVEEDIHSVSSTESPVSNDASSESSQSWEDYDREALTGHLDKQASISETFGSLKEQIEKIPALTSAITLRIPQRVVDNSYVQKAYMLFHAREFIELERNTRNAMLQMFCLILCMGAVFGELSAGLCLFAVSVCLFLYYTILAKWKSDICERLSNNREITADLFASVRQSKAVQFLALCAAAKAIHKFVKALRFVHEHQATLAPKKLSDLEERDAEVNPWCNPVLGELYVSHRNDTMTLEQVVAKVKNNLFHVTMVEDKFQQSCDILAIGGTNYLFPLHVFENRNTLKILVTRKDPDSLGGTFTSFLGVQNIIPIPGKDLCVVSLPAGGTRSDIVDLFPDKVTVSGNARIVYRYKDGSLSDEPIKATYIKDCESGGAGYQYHTPYNTFNGMCGAVGIGSFAKYPIIFIHLRGITGTASGKGLTIVREELRAAIAGTHLCRDGFPAHSAGTFPMSRYDKQVVTSRDIHPNSPLNYLPHGSNVEFMGSNMDRVHHTKSEVVETPISGILAEVTGVERKHGPPKFHNKKMWQAALAQSSNPSPGVEPHLLEDAIIDYAGHLIARFDEPEFRDTITKELKPLNDMEILCGRDGCRFIDAMKRGTSKGFPLSGPKSEMITLLPPEDYPDFACPAECDQMIMDQMRQMEDLLANGERCYAIFRACVKDEPTELGKDKVRVFQAADWAFQMVVRKYMLPIARILSMFPLDSECAVGVNAQGPEWDELAKHMRKFGADRIFAGDYSKYDLRMPAQLIIAAFEVYIQIAQWNGQYSERDITIMKGIATEIAYSCVSYNGDVIIHSGSNPSGHNMTVYVNCTVNSLLMRCAYFQLYPKELGYPDEFRARCSVMTYGDDFKGSTRKDTNFLNHLSYSHFLANRDMVLTMPDKKSEPKPYMNDDEADFLKRKNRFEEETGLIHGVLEEDSIWKSLHTVCKSRSVGLEDQSAQNIDGALREWWQYGRKVYDQRREQMKEVAEKAGISHLCNELNMTYDDRLEKFKERYL